jgi:hypothetical protein
VRALVLQAMALREQLVLRYLQSLAMAQLVQMSLPVEPMPGFKGVRKGDLNGL